MREILVSEMITSSGVKFGTSGARGLVSSMSDEVCYAYCAAFLQVAGIGFRGVVLGHDLRPSSPKLAAACAAAIRDAGLELIYCGALPTPALALHAASLGFPAVVVTGSHIPFDRNGIKFYRAEGEITKADEASMLRARVELPDDLHVGSLPAINPAARAAYVGRYVDFFGAVSLAGLRLAVYEHSSVAREVLREIFEALGATVISLGRTDTFVPIDTEAVRAEDAAQAKRWAIEHAFDAILSTDGDADRPLIGDEAGHWFRGDVVGILCAHYLQADTVVTPVSSNTALEISGWFKSVVRTRIGSPYVIAGMAGGQGVVVGYEANGGFLLGSDMDRNGRKLALLPTRDAVLPMLAMLCMAKEQGCALSALAETLPARFTFSDRLQDFPTETSHALVDQLLADSPAFAQWLGPDTGVAASVAVTDGLRVTFANGDIVHLRPSGNASELRCYAEASSEERAKQLCHACLAKIHSISNPA
jgi:phosphomannomutase